MGYCNRINNVSGIAFFFNYLKAALNEEGEGNEEDEGYHGV